MSFSSDLVDKVLAHVTTQVPGVTTRNALSASFVSEDQIGPAEIPWCQGFGVASESAAAPFGQRAASYKIDFELVDLPDLGDTTWNNINLIRDAILADWTLTGSVKRAWMSSAAVDETTKRDKTIGTFQITAAVDE